ncbi:helix-turn-helix domain-containing protein [Weissella hellenica]|uniref:Helix-turn-helix domain-containing protein n=1 Tax=Weissella hellenica TaxID=46256 RepID=A0A4Y4G3U2_WEIHE|nr:helix-turn-helix transcriptional regulator [Weissella hellenica]NKY67242.1 helix-turn-helix domain-containing protein [Weissella hellenica]GED36146.1 transcriptional regulator [Weissella hellenica]SCC00110.1 Helix-turn-helix domain-containing protein [Weissella hellenica]
MNKLGPTIKKIRIIKGLSQKQVYTSIISRSFANRFESGTNDIQAEKFLMILDNLGISPSEFQYINNNYELPLTEQLLTKVNYLYETHAFKTLSDWLNQYKESHDIPIQIVSGYAEVLLAAYSHHYFPLSKNIQLLILHLLNEKSWTLQEIKMVKILIPIIAGHEQFNVAIDTITARIEENYKHYLTKYADPFQVSDELINYYGVVLQNYLNTKNYQAAYDLRNKFNTDVLFLDWNGQISKQLWLAVWELYFGDYESGKATLIKIIDFKSMFPTSFSLNIDAIFKIRVADSKSYQFRQKNK